MTDSIVCTTAPCFLRSHFTGKERDTESGLDYFGARYYASSMGRFMSPDPTGGRLANPQTLNRYAYVVNNPLSFVDPTGLWHCTWNAVSGNGSDADDTEANGGASQSDCFSQGGEAWSSDPGDLPDLSFNGNQGQQPASSGNNNGDVPIDNPIGAGLFGPQGAPYWTGANTAVNWAAGLTAGIYGGGIAAAEFGPTVAANVIGRVSGTAVGAGTTVLGRFPAYIDKAQELGANALSIGKNAWNFLESTGETWTANRAFLDQAISRGDEFILASPPEGAQSWTYYGQELQYLRSQGYVVDPAASRLVIPH
jgi:RHS repeat-associated protein